jgi:hypothetical protein
MLVSIALQQKKAQQINAKPIYMPVNQLNNNCYLN